VIARANANGSSLPPVERIVRSAARGRRLALAVSGGRDSMAMMHAFARAARDSVAVVATFDHGTGPAATNAANLVVREASRHGFPVVLGNAPRIATNEAEWRDMRVAFLDAVASRAGAVVATAHTRDDQIETFMIRMLRDSGPRGLAGLYAESAAARPVLEVSRRELADYAMAAGVRWIEDPTNESDRYLRNRVRRDLLPALERAHPGFEHDVIAISRRAAEWRRQLDQTVESAVQVEHLVDGIAVRAVDLQGFAPDELALLWPSIAALAGARTDWRGTERLVAFTPTARVGARIQISGGWDVTRTRVSFELRRVRAATQREAARVVLLPP
jgi:tRNA(Ile)-lysidine synthase